MKTYTALSLVLASFLVWASADRQDCIKLEAQSAILKFPSSIATAGQPYVFTLEPIGLTSPRKCLYYDHLLTVQCLSESNWSFCQTDASIKPTADGSLRVTIWPATIRASYQPWPPPSTSEETLNPGTFAVNTTIMVRYNGTDLSGSPFPIVVRPADFAPAFSMVHILQPASGIVGRALLVARFSQIADKFSNWIRGIDLIDCLMVRVSSPDVDVKLHWIMDWWIEVRANSSKAGRYSFQLFYVYPNGNKEAIRIQTESTVDYVGWFEFLSGPLSVQDIRIYGLPSHARAGSNISITVQALDKFQNPTQWIDPQIYDTRVQQNQNASIIQVQVLGPSQEVQNAAKEFIADMGLARWYVQCFLTGSYWVAVMFKASSSVVLHNGTFEIYPGYASPRTSSQAIPTLSEAGLVSMEMFLRDEWGNPSDNWDTLTISVIDTDRNMSLSVYGPAFMSAMGLSYYSVLTLSGGYMVRTFLSGILWQEKTIFISAQRQPSLQRSQVIGYGAGLPRTNQLLTVAAPLESGCNYSLWVILRDVYGNSMDFLDVVDLHIDGPGVATVASVIRYSINGTLEYTYSIIRTGVYEVRVLLVGQVLHVGFVRVYPGVFHPPATLVGAPDWVNAGDLNNISMSFYDVWGNECPVSGDLAVIIRSYDHGTTWNEGIQLTAAVHADMALILNVAGEYAGACFCNERLVGSIFRVVVTPSTPSQAVLLQKGVSSTCIITAVILLMDSYMNIVQIPVPLEDINLTLEPDVSWEGNITVCGSSYQILLWSSPVSESQLTIMYQHSRLGLYKWRADEDQESFKCSLHVTTAIFAITAFSSALILISIGCFLGWKSQIGIIK
uniref:Plus gametic plasma membrane protein homolog n=1 Tax=Eudorina sp. NIES-3984 TaxID=1941220 RepID=A0A2Z5X899_9CHLO|nr:plus gametic plasma membrane protein homolog [Eudorina sp. NIES-3984]